MDERTKAIGSSKTRLHNDLQQRFKEVQEKTDINASKIDSFKNDAQLLSHS